MKIYLDGQLVPRDEAKVSVFDHGFLYGDGVFEGIRVYNGRIFRLDAHLERLWRCAKAIMLEPPMSKAEFGRAIEETVIANAMPNGYVRAIFSRGPGDLGLDPRKCSKPTTVVIADTIKLYPPAVYEHGMECVTVSTRRSRPDVLSPAIKSLNYLNHILAKIECNRAGVPECIMLNDRGLVAECSADNVFIYARDYSGRAELRTPPITAGSLEGITRDAVMQIAAELGIQPSMLRSWRAAQNGMPSRALAGLAATNGQVASPADLASENAKLRRELERTRMERDVLKKAIGIFAEVPR